MFEPEAVANALQGILDELTSLPLPRNRTKVKACLFRAEYLRDRLLFHGRADLVKGFDQAIAAALGEDIVQAERAAEPAPSASLDAVGADEGPEARAVAGPKRGFKLPIGFAQLSGPYEATSMTRTNMKGPRIFVQYAHVDDCYRDAALAFANRLRGDGIESMIDFYDPHPLKGWQDWMTRNLRDADYVLILCSADNLTRFNKEAPPGVGHGAVWEGHLIQLYLYEGGGVNSRFIPIILRQEDHDYIPDVLRSATHYRVYEPVGYEQLLRRLTNQPEVSMPPVGSVRHLPPRKV